MDDLMSRVFQHAYADVVYPWAEVDLHVGHFSAAVRAVQQLRDLSPDLRIERVETERGLMWITLGFERPLPEATIHAADAVVRDATRLSAWSCSRDGQPGWLVDTPLGPRVWCAECQEARGYGVKRHVV